MKCKVALMFQVNDFGLPDDFGCFDGWISVRIELATTWYIFGRY